MRRREFLSACAACGAAALAACADGRRPALPPGEMSSAAMDLGHRLRDGGLPPPAESLRVPVLIVGAGVGGLAAGWKLAQSGFRDFLIVDLESIPGGNSRAGRNAIGDYPLAAHYLPLPTREATGVRELLAELGVLEGDPGAERPRYDERYLCAMPQERLYRNGWWEDGLYPQVGVAAAERAQYRRFHEITETLRARRDGRRPAFALPMALSSPARDLVALDRLTMREWLAANGFDSPHLLWHIDYACRDDYGTGIDAVSAWAGLHYFASRSGEARDASGDTVLTTPGGNGWLVEGMARRIRERAGDRLLTGAPAYRVAPVGTRLAVDLWLAGEARSLRVEADQLIWAAPLFLVPRVFVGHEDLRQGAAAFTHAPWLVANLSLERLPAERGGAPLAWDNVLYDQPGLGYVVSTHQQLRSAPGPSVITYYRALADRSPAEARTLLQARSREEWAEEILAELEVPHPDIRRLCSRLDVNRLAHAMVRPVPGLIWGAPRRAFAADRPNLRFAHADVSGLSLFEEAHYRGVLAAERTLARLGRRVAPSPG